MDYYAYIIPNDSGIVFTWDECKKKVHGVSGSKFKKFKKEEEALIFIGLLKKEKNETSEKDVFFIDGSFDSSSCYYSYGLVYLKHGKIIHMESGKSNKYPESRQVGGEIMGVMKALNIASKNKLERVVIAYDYEGIRSHALGLWKAKEETSQIYKKWFDSFKEKNQSMEIVFEKIKAHSGNICNEYADELAKRELGMSGPFEKQMLEELSKLKTRKD